MADTYTTSELIDLVSRLRKENEWLNEELSCFHLTFDGEIAYRRELVKRARSEAIREFAKRLKNEFYGGYYNKPFIYNTINYILKELESK